jgi:hypothetical protein
MGAVSTYLAIALAVFVVAVIAGLVLAGIRGLDLWRAFKRFRRTVLAGMDDLNRRVAVLQQRADALPAKIERLDEARASLERAVAEARVISDAFGEATAMVRAARILLGLR